MHIPASDSLRQKRMGVITDGDTYMLLEDFVQTAETNEPGAHDPIESLSRPFPYVVNTQSNPIVVEDFINRTQFQQLSDGFVEYAAFVQKSVEDGEWVSELDDFSEDDFGSTVEAQLASGILNLVSSGNLPDPVVRHVLSDADTLIKNGLDEVPGASQSSLRGIADNSRYDFSYLPEKSNEIDEWELKHSQSKQEIDGDNIFSETLWLRYSTSETEQERPLVTIQSGGEMHVAFSPKVTFAESPMSDASRELVSGLLDTGSSSTSPLTNCTVPETSRTYDYLSEFLKSSH